FVKAVLGDLRHRDQLRDQDRFSIRQRVVVDHRGGLLGGLRCLARTGFHVHNPAPIKGSRRGDSWSDSRGQSLPSSRRTALADVISLRPARTASLRKNTSAKADDIPVTFDRILSAHL